MQARWRPDAEPRLCRRADVASAQDVKQGSSDEIEDQCRLYSAYAWLGYRIPEYFPSIEAAQALARTASDRVDALLQPQIAARRLRRGPGGR